MIPAKHIVAPEQMSKRGELLGPSQFFQQAAQADDSSRESELGKRRHVGPQLSQPAEDVGIAVQLLQGVDLRMVSTQVSQEQVDGTVILNDRGFAECRCRRFRRTLERLRKRMLERSSSASHIYECNGGRMCCATARAYC